jgi:hypothetical protein
MTLANSGRGKHEFVTDGEVVANKTLHLLKCALSPNITDFKINYEHKTSVAYTIPDPKTLSFIIGNEPIEFLFLFNKTLEKIKKTSITLEYFNHVKKQTETCKVQLELQENLKSDPSLVKYGMFRFSKALKNKIACYQNPDQPQEEINDPKIKNLIKDVTNQLVTISTNYKILTDKTAFFCVLKQGDDISNQIPVEHLTIPHLRPDLHESADESSSGSDSDRQTTKTVLSGTSTFVSNSTLSNQNPIQPRF